MDVSVSAAQNAIKPLYLYPCHTTAVQKLCDGGLETKTEFSKVIPSEDAHWSNKPYSSGFVMKLGFISVSS
jgi:hypothetical protein